MARFLSRRWGQSRLPIPIQTSSMSAPDRTACAAMCRPVAASISPPMVARPGSSSASMTPARSAAFVSTRRIPTSPGSRRTATPSSRMQNAVSSRRPTAARRGARRCSSLTRSAPWTSSCSPAIPTSSMPGCRISSASRGRSSAARRKAVSTRARTAATRLPRSRTVCPAISSARATSPSPPPSRIESTR